MPFSIASISFEHSTEPIHDKGVIINASLFIILMAINEEAPSLKKKKKVCFFSLFVYNLLRYLTSVLSQVLMDDFNFCVPVNVYA